MLLTLIKRLFGITRMRTENVKSIAANVISHQALPR